MDQVFGLSGAGRIGRSFLRALALRLENMDAHVVVNDLAPIDQFAYLLENDSTRGRTEVTRSGGGRLRLAGLDVEYIPSQHPPCWGEAGVDVVLEATGRRTSAESASCHLEAGAQRVVVTAPAEGADLTVVVGYNEHQLAASHRIISAASCTTNCLVPMAAALHDAFEVEAALLSTVHSYTSDQRLLDSPHVDLRRGRGAATNIIPTTTGAARAVGLVLPDLVGLFDGRSFRVPVADVSLIDLTVLLARDASAHEVNHVLSTAAIASTVMDAVDAPLVSSDILGRPVSCTVDLGMTQAIGRLAKVVGWYDNEWGYANRLVDLASLLIGDSA